MRSPGRSTTAEVTLPTDNLRSEPNDFVLFDIWVDGAGSPTVTVTGPGGGTSGAVASGATFGQNTVDGARVLHSAGLPFIVQTTVGRHNLD